MFRKVFILLIIVAAVACRSPDESTRILGGRNVLLGEIPYQASLQFWGTSFHFAGGVLLNSRWVVTTAHGLVGRAGNSINIVLGVVRLDLSFTNRRSIEIRIHPFFDLSTLSNDIATIRSATVITFTNNILPISLSPTYIGDGVIGHVSGWGATNEDKSNTPTVLQQATVETGPCRDSTSITFNPSQHFCAGTSLGSPTVGICTIDVGGPLVLNNILIGIPFFHDPRGCGLNLDGYLRISNYRTWIIGNIPV